MIVVEIKLVSAVDDSRDEELGTLVVDNITTRDKMAVTRGKRCDYRARMYRKGALAKAGGSSRRMVSTAAHTREARVDNHSRYAEPVQNLVAKALAALGYR